VILDFDTMSMSDPEGWPGSAMQALHMCTFSTDSSAPLNTMMMGFTTWLPLYMYTVRTPVDLPNDFGQNIRNPQKEGLPALLRRHA
jgi:hypothetical protein